MTATDVDSSDSLEEESSFWNSEFTEQSFEPLLNSTVEEIHLVVTQFDDQRQRAISNTISIGSCHHLQLQYQFYKFTSTNETKRSERQSELDRVLQMHLLNPNINAIHLLLESKDPHVYEIAKPFITSKKVYVTVIETMLTFKTAMEYAHNHLQGKWVILCNADVYFDDSIKQLKTIKNWKDRLLSLSKHELSSDPSPYYCKRYTGSHDSYIFVPPLRNITALLPNIDFRVGGIWGYVTVDFTLTFSIENRFMYELEMATGIKADNPCFKIKSYHMHRSGLRNAGEDRVNKDGRSRNAHPHDHLEGVAQKPWGWIKPPS